MNQWRLSMAVICARVMDASTRSVVFETLGASDKIESFVADMVEISRTDLVAVARGWEGT